MGLLALTVSAAIAVPWLLSSGIDVPLNGDLVLVAAGLIVSTALYGALGVSLGAIVRNQTTAAAVVLVNAFLFPAEVDRILARDGALVWVNSSGAQTPIFLAAEDLLAALPGQWTGTASQAGEGTWCVLRKIPNPKSQIPNPNRHRF